MNRRNDPVEELVDGAREAVHAEDFERAIALLREANRLAPMRQDIRQFLGAILEGTSVGPDEPVSYRETRASRDARDQAVAAPQAGAEEEECASRIVFDRQVESTAFRHITPRNQRDRSLSGPSEELPREEPDKDGDNVLKISLARRLAETPEPDVHSADSSPEPFVPYSEMRGLSAQATEYQDDKPGEDRATARGRKRRDRGSADSDSRGEAESGNAAEAGGSGRLRLRFPSPSARILVFAAVYACIALFLITASVVTHGRFFGKRDRDSTTAPPSVDTPRPGNAASNSMDRTEEEIIRLASDYFQNERFDDCIALLSRAVKSGGASATRQRMSGLLASAYEAKGTRQLLANQIADSAESYVKAVDLSPDNPDYTLRLGNAYYYCATSLGNGTAGSYYNKALDVLTRTVELDPRNVLAYELLASVYVGLEKTSQAQAALVKIVEIAPSSDQAELARRKLKTLTMAE